MRPPRSVDTIRLTPGMLIAACVVFQVASGSNAAAQSDLDFEPYSVFVAQDEAFARCGPSGEYYRTDRLRHGQALDVYAETDDGWLGIRPPDDSFCWVPAETVETDGADDSGTVIEDRTVAWIGTHLGRARKYRWQVQLAEGEPVTIVGRSEREGPDGPQLWFRIVPPSGEYRWVHRDQIVMSSEELVASIRRPSDSDEKIILYSDDLPTTATKPVRTASTESRPREREPAIQSSRRNSPAPRNVSQQPVVAASGPSIMEQEEAVGSGLEENWQATEAQASVAQLSTARQTPTLRPAPEPTADTSPKTVFEAVKRRGLLGSIEFLGRPRLLEIGGTPSAPSAGETAGDANWVAGVARAGAAGSNPAAASTRPVTPSVGSTQFASSPGSLMHVSAQQPTASSNLLPPVAPAMNKTTVVSSERIAEIEAETRGADVERLSLIFSRLMAAQATAAETEPVARAASALAMSSLDSVAAGRARLLAERAEQYRRVASRRDGEAVIRSNGLGAVPVAPASFQNPVIAGTRADTADAAGSTQTGYLVQVYSARSNSPPFALTDNAGRTVAYVTPTPGVNLRIHLNSRVSVIGNPGFLTGLNTPHILATQAVRTPE